MKNLKEMDGSDFHIIAHIAYLVALIDGKHEDCKHVKKLAYDMYEERKKNGKFGI